MLFTKHCAPPSINYITINNVNVETVSKTKFLGIIIHRHAQKTILTEATNHSGWSQKYKEEDIHLVVSYRGATYIRPGSAPTHPSLAMLLFSLITKLPGRIICHLFKTKFLKE